MSLVSERTITIDLNTPVRLADAPALIAQVFAWWVAELASFAPSWLRSRLPKQPETACLHVNGNAWRILANGDEARALELDASASDKEIADRILQAAPNFSLSRLMVVVSRSTVLQRRIELPLIPEASLRPAVELQIDRLLPFQVDAVRFDARIHERDAVEGTMLVDVIATPKGPIEDLEQRLRALNFKPVAIDVDSGNGGRAGFDLRAREQSESGRTAMLTTIGFAAGAALAWYLAFSAWGVARDREIESWRAAVTELQPVAARSAALRRQVDGLIEPLQMARAYKPGLALNPLVELTNILPDTVRVTEFRLTGEAIELSGLATDAPTLIAKLEASKLFKEVKFRSPVTRRPELNKERFEITLKLERSGR